MLEHLHVENVALIECADIAFGEGLNVLSGETGAGKSMLIDAVVFALGGRSGKDFIRSGREQACVEALFSMGEAAAEAISAMGVHIGGDGRLLIYRSVHSSGRTSCKINGRSATVALLREVSALLVDVHGQHEHQSLLSPARHIALLDRLCGEGLDAQKHELLASIARYKDVLSGIRESGGSEKERAARIEELKYIRNEIESARLKEGEEEALIARRDKLANLERLTDCAYEALELMSGGESGERPGAAEQVARAARLLEEMSALDESQSHLSEALETALAQLEDIARDIRHYAADLDPDPHALSDIDARIDLIYTLKRKYGGALEDVMARGRAVAAELDRIESGGEALAALRREKKKYAAEITEHCEALSLIRRNAAAALQAEIASVLRELGMKDARFEIAVERKKEFGANGFDRVEFMIAPNPGEALMPLAKIASGGEMSRVMLALKTVLSGADTIETFVFDEIDTGVSGRTAQKVAEKLSLIGGEHQILCITHLPQIAAIADRHFLIEKTALEERTSTNVTALDYDGITQELARLIGGAKITDATVKAAGEMKQMAMKLRTRNI